MTDRQMYHFFEGLREVWRLNRTKTLATLIDELKMLSDNPYRESYDATDVDLALGITRYLKQERHDHPERFEQADREDQIEEERLAAIKPFKEMTPEEKRQFRIKTIAEARKVHQQNIARRHDEGH